MLQVQDLWKSYDSRQVVSGVSFDAAPGQIIGLLGPNGAGKTTTVSMICGLTPADRGSVVLAGQRILADTSDAKRKIGLVPQVTDTGHARYRCRACCARYQACQVRLN